MLLFTVLPAKAFWCPVLFVAPGFSVSAPIAAHIHSISVGNRYPFDCQFADT